MENSILTPLQLWADFDLQKEPLQTAFLHSEAKDGGTEFDVYINGERCGDGQTRIYVHGVIPQNARACKAVICIGDNDLYTESGTMRELLDEGYCLLNFDYRGYDPQIKRKYFTRYPQSIAYANLAQAGDHLTKATPSAKDTCVFIWSKVCRSVITLAKEICGADAPVFLLGVRAGADIMWQAGAMDKRVTGLIGVINAGWREYGCASKFSASFAVDYENADDERVRWLAGCAPQTYAKFVTCPTLFIGTTNSNITSIDRVENTLNTIREHAPVHASICAGLSNTVDETALNTVNAWIRAVANGSKMPESPRLDLIVEGDKVVAEARFDDSEAVSEINVFYCYDELQSDLRSWKKITLPLANPRTVLPVYVNNKIVFAFVNVIYDRRLRLSSLPDALTLEGKRLNCEPLRKRHIIYERKDGTSMWIAENADQYSTFITPTLAAGAYELMGVTAPSGDLSTYVVGEPQYRSERHNLLQFDAYCDRDVQCVVVLCADEGAGNHSDYRASVRLTGGAWTKCTLQAQDFKTEERIALKDWNAVKKLTFRDVKGVLFNNILWV